MFIKKEAPTGEPDQVVELRVHGVGGSTPERLLAHTDSDRYGTPHKIAGDDITGFYRGDWDEKSRHRVLEGYLWGGLTSKKVSRALWLLLLPFALANVAGWMINPQDREPAHPAKAPRKPATDAVRGWAKAQMALVRLFSAGTTVMLMAWFGTLLADLVAYQCGGQVTCTDGRVWMTPFTAEAIAGYPTRRLLIGSAALLIVVAGLAVLTFRSINRYERETFGEVERSIGRDGAGLADREFWASGELVRRLTYLHLGLSITVVATLYSLSVDGLMSTEGFAMEIGSVIAIVIGAVLLVAIPIAPTRGLDWTGRGPMIHLSWVGPLALLVILMWQGWSAIEGETTYEPGHETVFGRAPLYVAIALLVLVLIVLALRFRDWWSRPSKPWWAAAAATVFWGGITIVAVFWGLPEYSRFVVASVGAFIVVIAWIMARRPQWQAVIALIVLVATTTMWVGGADDHWSFFGLVALAAAALLTAALRTRGGLAAGLGAAVALAALAIWLVDIPENTAVQWIGIALLGLVVLPTVAADLGRKDEWRWGGPVTAAGLSLVILVVFASGGIVAWADFLDRGEPGALCEPAQCTPEISYLSIYDLLALVVVAAALVVVISAVVHYVRIRFDVWGSHGDAIAAEYREREPDPREPDEIRADVKDCLEPNGSLAAAAVKGRSIGSAARDVDVFLTALTTIAVVACTLGLARIALREGSWAEFVTAIELPAVTDDWSVLVRASVVVIGLLPLLGVGLIQNARSDEDARKSIGTLWDVLTFWPRRFHPLAPPSYAERAVPELATRIRQLSADGSKVIVVAHSQGSVIAAGSVGLLLGTGKLAWRRVYVVTHGSPLGRLYRRAFPGYWGGGMLRFFRRELGWGADGGWLNLHRLTDPIGDAIFTGPDEHVAATLASTPLPAGDKLLFDPASRWRFELDACPGVEGHSNYLNQSEAVTFLDTLGAALRIRYAAEQSHRVRVEGHTVQVAFATTAAGSDLIGLRAEIEAAVVDLWDRMTTAIGSVEAVGPDAWRLRIGDLIRAELRLDAIDRVNHVTVIEDEVEPDTV